MSCDRSLEIDLAAFAVEPRAPEFAEFRAHYLGCADCSSAVMNLTALETALREATGGAHPSDEALVAYAEGEGVLPQEERREIQSHLEACAPCRDALVATTRFDLEAAVAGARPPEPERVSWLERARETLASLLPAPVSPVLAGAALAVLLMIPAAFLVRGILTEGESSPQVAQELPEPASVPVREVVAEPGPSSRLAEALPPAPLPQPEPPAPSAVPPQTSVAQQAPADPPPKQVEPTAPATPEPREIVLAARPPPSIAPPAPAPPPMQELFRVAAVAPTYAAPPGAERIAGDSRLGVTVRAAGARLPRVNALTPEHVGRTVSHAPSLYWFLETPTDRSLQISLLEPESGDPVAEVRLDGPHAAGIHGLSLAEHGVELEPALTYQWFVSVLAGSEPGPEDRIAGSFVLRAERDAALARQLASASPGEQAGIYASRGFWYDALGELSSDITGHPELPVLREQRADLLAQVGLAAAAAFERASLRGGVPDPDELDLVDGPEGAGARP